MNSEDKVTVWVMALLVMFLPLFILAMSVFEWATGCMP